jgi:UDP-glucose 4-epimerase
MKILVTGGAGFIGSHLVDKLIERGHHVIIVDSLIDGYMENINHHLDGEKCAFIQQDIRDTTFILEKLVPVDMIYHMAADPDVKSSVPHPLSSYDHNMNGTINILQYMRKHDIHKMVFASSGGTVYGEVEEFPITEDTPFKPISPYGASKAAAEMYLSAYAHAYGMKMASVRYANIFGERSRHGIGYDFYHKLKENPSSLQILGDGTQQKSYLHVSDTVTATIMVGDHLKEQKEPYEGYNVGSEDWYTVNEIAAIFERELGFDSVEHHYTGGSKGWVGDVAKVLLSIDKIKNLGFEPQVSYREAVHRYVNWLDELES